MPMSKDTCSSGAVGCLAIGLGVADVAIPLITGETWFKIPECISIKFTGELLPGIGGKDVILHILKELKRNTVAANRIVEFSGPGMKCLSIDARFAISNMCAVSLIHSNDGCLSSNCNRNLDLSLEFSSQTK